MTKHVKLIAVGNSTGAIFPKEILARLGANQGDVLSVVDTPLGIELRTGEPGFDEQMELAREIMKRRRQALRELAK